MKVLACQVSWNSFYRGNESIYPCDYIKDGLDQTNFINLNGFYFAYFNGEGLSFENNIDKISVDYLIFVSKHPTKGMVVIGWFKHATIFNQCQKHHKGNYYYAIGRDEDCVLLKEEHRDYALHIDGAYSWIELNKKLKLYIEKSKHRVNYRQSDVNTALNINLTNLEDSCAMIEKTILSENYLQSLQLTNRAIMLFGTKASLIYYKAWILYLLLQYNHSVKLLSQIMNVSTYKDLVHYMLGNIFFETEDYDRSIKFLLNVKTTNIDLTQYMLAQAYAMKKQIALARGAIEKAINANPTEIAYQDFKTKLKEWNHE